MRTDYKKGSLRQGMLFLGLIGLFLFGLTELFQMRFSAGDIYPAYSSLRADPLGTKAYLEAIGRIRDISAERNYKRLPKLDTDSTLFILGVSSKAVGVISEEEARALESFISGGGRLVMTFLPEVSVPEVDEKVKDKEKPNSAEKKNYTSLPQRWGFALSYQKTASGQRQKPQDAIAGAGRPLSPSVPWHSAAFFDAAEQNWIPIYKVSDRPVMVERRYGKGTIVLATDTYFASNEAILRDRRPELLAWLAGPHKKIVFDETHNGILETPGVASLFRKYNLHAFFAGFILLAGVYIWKNSMSLVPARAEDDAGIPDFTTGRDQLSGIISLLRRNVPPGQLLEVCIREWRRGLPKTAVPTEKMKMVERAADEATDGAHGELQVKAYKSIVNLLSERISHGK